MSFFFSGEDYGQDSDDGGEESSLADILKAEQNNSSMTDDVCSRMDLQIYRKFVQELYEFQV